VYDGRPLAGVEVRLADPDAAGVGRIELGGPTVFSGYRLRPDLTAVALVDGFHVTSDLGRFRSDGTLEVLGRADDVIVTGGEKIAPSLVEQRLLAHPAVAACAVVARPDPTWGQRVVAVIVATDPSSPPTLAELRDHVGASLPRSAAPRELQVVDALPLLATGKIDRAALTG
jgi:O-succinylbenzoic acid--CoA ligase